MCHLKMSCVLNFLLFVISFSAARGISVEKLHRLPQLFHLDDYDRCLSQKDGVYCMGTFQLAPKKESHPLYDIMTEHNKQYYTFDRRFLHRGYCLNKRCPSNEKNTTLRFEQCVDKLVRKQSLTANLKKLAYCKTHIARKTKMADKPDLAQRMFAYTLYGILFLNVLGTLHEVYGDGKNKLLLAWSVPANCRSLFSVDEGDTTSIFAPIQSCKVILHAIIIYTHSNLVHYMSYIHNPEDVENSRHSFVNKIIMNGTSLVQVFLLISAFFTAYSVLSTAQRSTITGKVTAKLIVKRMFRLAPVFLLLTSYSATWWARYGDGPQWTPLVEAESQICRRKFWTHLFFVNNFVEPYELCMVQSWGIAAELQLYFVSLFLTLLFLRLKVRAVPILGAMFVASCLFNISLAYFMELVPMVKIIVPEKLRVEFRGSNSFFHLHMSPWSNLPACLFGLLIAHIYFEQKNRKAKKNEEISNKISDVPSNSNEMSQNGVIEKGNEVTDKVRVNAEIVKENKTTEAETVMARNENGKNANVNVENIKENKMTCDNGLKLRKVIEETKCNDKQNGVFGSEKQINGIQNGHATLNETSNQKQIESEDNKDKSRKKRAPFLLRYAHCFTIPTLIWWIVWGSRIVAVESTALIALYVGLERLIFSLTFAIQLLQVITVKGPWARLMSWRGWTIPARLVFSVAMLHWCVNITIAAGRPVPINSSLLYVSMDWLATMFYSFVLAIPMCLLVELPMKKFGDALVSLF